MANYGSNNCGKEATHGWPRVGRPTLTSHQVSDGQKCLSLFDAIWDGIFQITNEVSIMEIVLKDVGSARDSTVTRDRIGESTKIIKNLVQNTRMLISKCKIPRGNKMYSIQLHKLISDYEEAVGKFEAVKEEAARKMMTRVPVETQPCFTSGPDKDCSVVIEQEISGVDEMIQPIQCQAHAQVYESDVDFLQDREERILQIESDMYDINHIFHQLSGLVHEQGQKLDDIEGNIQSTNIAIENATEHLAKAAELKCPSASPNIDVESAARESSVSMEPEDDETSVVNLLYSANADEKTPLLGARSTTARREQKEMHCPFGVFIFIIVVIILTVVLLVCGWNDIFTNLHGIY